MSVYQLAKLADVTETAIRHWEKGERAMGIEYADKVFKALNVRVTIGAIEGGQE